MCDTADAWIVEFTHRVSRGELATFGRVRLDGWPIALEAELAAKILLADLHDLDDRSDEERMTARIVARRSMVVDDLRHLHEKIDEARRIFR